MNTLLALALLGMKTLSAFFIPRSSALIFRPSPASTTSSTTATAEPRSAIRRLRPWIIALFAVILLARAGFADSLVDAPIMQWDGTTDIEKSAMDHVADVGRSVRIVNTRAQSVELFAESANLDRDVEPDGWRANLVIRNQRDQVITPRANARFELFDRLSGRDSFSTIRWSMPVEYEANGQANFQLRLRGDDRRRLRTRQWDPNTRWSQSFVSDPQHRNHKIPLAVQGDFFRNTWVPSPRVARLVVTVNVPGQGSYQAETPVWIHVSK